MKKPICLMLLVSFFLSCSESIRFEQPQPAQKAALKRIPKKLRGTYFVDDDSTYLYITKKRIIEHEHSEIREHKDSLIAEIMEEGYELKQENNRDFSIEIEGIRAQMTRKGDSLIGVLTLIDTLFEISDKHVIKEWDGTYFMNVIREGQKYWRLRAVTLESDVLSVARIKKGQIDSLRAITKVEKLRKANGNSDVYLLNPSPDELRTLLDKRSKIIDTYRKIK